jgi:hypothetical protein
MGTVIQAITAEEMRVERVVAEKVFAEETRW